MGNLLHVSHAVCFIIKGGEQSRWGCSQHEVCWAMLCCDMLCCEARNISFTTSYTAVLSDASAWDQPPHGFLPFGLFGRRWVLDCLVWLKVKFWRLPTFHSILRCNFRTACVVGTFFLIWVISHSNEILLKYCTRWLLTVKPVIVRVDCTAYEKCHPFVLPSTCASFSADSSVLTCFKYYWQRRK